ncbi:phospholipid-translocating P-type ATPase [Phycomyces blakesleeanus]|uniref:Phospholipid-transporting ATPase n=1 Tax=Phycomyces blakesleeanus TaxID=4837 RepID=A0ABR3AK61_PHYBL
MDEELGESSFRSKQRKTSRKRIPDIPLKFLKSRNNQQPRTIPFNCNDKIKKKFTPNIIVNQKYNIFTFIPIVLYEQFVIFFNLYFLLVALSQFVPALKIGYILTYFGPLCFVLLVTISKEAMDDYQRHKRDKEANSQQYQTLTSSGLINIPSSKIRVGDLIVVHKDQRIPADMILLRTTEEKQTNWTEKLTGKLRLAVPSLQRLSCNEELLNCSGEIYADSPHKDIHNFVGTYSHVDPETGSEQLEPLGVENSLWTTQFWRLVTQITKIGLLDKEVNRLAKILFVVTLAMSFICLRVNLDMGKQLYARQIEGDEEIAGTIVRTSTLPEELGRIEYLLSDKTGTLTKNDMELKKLHMGTMSYTLDTMDDIVTHLGAAFEKHDTGMSGKGRRNISYRVKDIVQALALCHNVIYVMFAAGNNEVTYQASSPDEVAIVKWTEEMGLALVSRDVNKMQLMFVQTILKQSVWVLLFGTSSLTRLHSMKRGADSVMTSIVQYNDWLEEECGNMAREGLRTLVVAKKKLSEEAYEEFRKSRQEIYHEAEVALLDRNGRKQAVVENLLETDLELLGLTGVEDKLQDGVKNTLEQMRNANLKIWMLTGDKIETATCIAVSSKLVSRNQQIYQVSKLKSPVEVLEELDHLRNQTDCCLVIDGESLQLCLDSSKDEFIEVATRLPVVVCCRCSPTQKADITRLIKKYTRKRVLCIGDGGNDVSMIQAADVEGKQASLAADFSITQFSHLTKLLLWHGRNSYKRSAKLSQFVIHRGLIISVMQAVFSALFYFAPIALYQGMLIVGYATLYTMAPVFSLVLDQDVNEDIALLYPELYKELTKGRSLSNRTFFTWLLISVYQGGSIMVLSILLFEDEFIHIVSISFTALILNELLMVALEINTWHRIMVISELVTIMIYIGSMWLLPTYFDMTFILTWGFVWKVAVMTAVSSFPLYIVKFIKRRYAPPSYTKLT